MFFFNEMYSIISLRMVLYCLQIVGSQVEIQYGSSLSFIGNNAEDEEGGALYIQDFGQIKVYPRSSLEFVNNTGR